LSKSSAYKPEHLLGIAVEDFRFTSSLRLVASPSGAMLDDMTGRVDRGQGVRHAEPSQVYVAAVPQSF
jgi:hypothetical protein